MMRKKSILMVLLMIIVATTLMVSCSSGPQGKEIVIEGEFTNLPDSMYLNLLEDVGQMLDMIDGDSVIGGKFRFEGISNDGGVNPALIFNAKRGMFPYHTLWIMPGARIKITADGMDFSKWKIKSNVPAQKTENKFRANILKELSEFSQAYMDFYVTKDEKYYQCADSILLVAIPRKDIPLLEKLPVDESWMNHLYYLSISKDTTILAKGKELSQRMSEEQKNSYRGKRIMKNLFPSQVVNVGDMIPDIELKDTLGNTHRLQELKGKYLLLDFWSSGCSPCIKSFPELKKIAKEMKDSLEV
ncbi:MAG: AhpC/TSA family protein, partial [Bacteroidaceae bacterium]|nr:AhpC/TSA family protein [Bacteroidaceae bacterium]